MKKALFLCGGWEGHQPREIVRLFTAELSRHDFHCEVAESLDALDDPGRLADCDLVFPCWTMGSLDDSRCRNLCEAVRRGTALAGIHGGMGDAFRGSLDYEWMVGGHFVGHPHVGEYQVRVRDPRHPATRSLPPVFPFRSEQYYMLVDPAVHVLADSDYHFEGRSVVMPVVWTRSWGRGRVFYSALGHAPSEFDEFPHVREMTVRGLLWAAGLLD